MPLPKTRSRQRVIHNITSETEHGQNTLPVTASTSVRAGDSCGPSCDAVCRERARHGRGATQMGSAHATVPTDPQPPPCPTKKGSTITDRNRGADRRYRRPISIPLQAASTVTSHTHCWRPGGDRARGQGEPELRPPHWDTDPDGNLVDHSTSPWAPKVVLPGGMARG